jgi:hypothetical protein
MVRKPITDKDAPPRPWRIATSQGGKIYMYAHGESQPIALIKSKHRLTRRDRATLELICMAVNYFHEHELGFFLSGH